LPSMTRKFTTNIVTKSDMVSKKVKYKVIVRPIAHPTMTTRGVTNKARVISKDFYCARHPKHLPIWILLPRATPIAKSILFFDATTTAVTCSAAFPTIGRMINPIKA